MDADVRPKRRADPLMRAMRLDQIIQQIANRTGYNAKKCLQSAAFWYSFTTRKRVKGAGRTRRRRRSSA